ncbi:energy transducer TonB [Massilia sp. LXY-6]|uniref:energy transducer TonB n=1 Tax=Massilia sp. LXY-6 TaxID=3379823 RepID=UPI003EE208DE
MSRNASAATIVLLGLLTACAGPGPAASKTAASTVDTRPAILDFNSCAKPMYPHEELQAGHEGTVKLGFLVKPDGTIGGTKLVQSSGFPALDEAARTALAACRFHPATRNGQPAETWTDVIYVWARH